MRQGQKFGDNPGNGKPNTAIGKRIFPDLPVPPDQLPSNEDREAYRKAKVIVHVWGEPNTTKTVYLRLLDPDDPSAPDTQEELPIDNNDGVIQDPSGGVTFVRRPNDNRREVEIVEEVVDGRRIRREVERFPSIGMFEGGGTDSQVDVNLNDEGYGRAEVIVLLSRQPGNNFKVAGAFDNSVRDGLHIKEGTQEEALRVWTADGKKVPEGNEPDIEPVARATELLTVWRRLWVEVDSMAAEFEIGTSTGLTANSLQDITKSWEEDQFNSYNEPWDLNPNIYQERTFRIVDTERVRVYVGEDNNLTAVAKVGDPYRIFYTFPPDRSTDDEFRGDVPDPDAEGLNEAFREAYIKVLLLPASYHQSKVAWHHNFRTSNSDLDRVNAENFRQFADRHRQSLPEADDWWTIYVIGIYEIVSILSDNDPNEELCSPGMTYEQEPDFSAVCFENIRDLAVQWGWTEEEKARVVRATVIHEIGHQFGLRHNKDLKNGIPTNIMWAPDKRFEEPKDLEETLAPLTPLRFLPDDINKIRSTLRP
jgi:hypothetical protein